MAYLEAQIDFPDEGDTEHLHRGHVLTRVRDKKVLVPEPIAREDATH